MLSHPVSSVAALDTDDSELDKELELLLEEEAGVPVPITPSQVNKLPTIIESPPQNVISTGQEEVSVKPASPEPQLAT